MQVKTKAMHCILDVHSTSRQQQDHSQPHLRLRSTPRSTLSLLQTHENKSGAQSRFAACYSLPWHFHRAGSLVRNFV